MFFTVPLSTSTAMAAASAATVPSQSVGVQTSTTATSAAAATASAVASGTTASDVLSRVMDINIPFALVKQCLTEDDKFQLTCTNRFLRNTMLRYYQPDLVSFADSTPAVQPPRDILERKNWHIKLVEYANNGYVAIVKAILKKAHERGDLARYPILLGRALKAAIEKDHLQVVERFFPYLDNPTLEQLVKDIPPDRKAIAARCRLELSTRENISTFAKYMFNMIEINTQKEAALPDSYSNLVKCVREGSVDKVKEILKTANDRGEIQKNPAIFNQAIVEASKHKERHGDLMKLFASEPYLKYTQVNSKVGHGRLNRSEFIPHPTPQYLT